MSNSTRGSRPTKPEKPHADIPLFPHATGRWAKKVRGKLHYFGKWDDPQAALAKWQEQKDELLAGRKPRAKQSGGPTVRDVANSFMKSRLARLEAGELRLSTHDEYEVTCRRFVKLFGLERPIDDLRPGDFARLRALILSLKYCGNMSEPKIREFLENFDVQVSVSQSVLRGVLHA